MTTDGDRTVPAGLRRARVALLVVGAVVLLVVGAVVLLAAAGVGAALGAPAGTIASLVDRWGRPGPARPSGAKTPAWPAAWTPA